MIIISIDPQVDKSAGAFHWWKGGPHLKPCGAGAFKTGEFIKNPLSFILTHIPNFPWGVVAKRIAIIEGQYVGISKKSSLALCKAANRMAGALIANGFTVYEAPVWNSKKRPGIPQQLSWMAEHLSIGGRPQTRAQNKKLSVALAKQIWLEVASVDEADAINIGQWWWAKNKFKYIGV